MMHSLYWPVSDIMTGGQMLAGFFIGASMVINGDISVGTYLSYAGMLIWIIWPIRNMGRLIVQTSTGLVSFKRITKVIQQEREPLNDGDYIPESNSVRGEIIFKDVCFAYENNETVLRNINFRCNPGQVIALLGSTGSGKSTLGNLLPRFYEYSDGSISLDGVELKRYPRQFLRSQIGIVEQEPFLFSRTAAQAAVIHEAIINFKDGYDTMVGEKGVTLSGGQKQRIAIARTIIKNPRILILDDATSSVDVETESEIRAALDYLMKNRTTFIIAHRIQSVISADKIIVLDGGRILQMGTHNELLAQGGAYQQIYDIQTRIETELREEISTQTHSEKT